MVEVNHVRTAKKIGILDRIVDGITDFIGLMFSVIKMCFMVVGSMIVVNILFYLINLINWR